jgi:hypothetical protein
MVFMTPDLLHVKWEITVSVLSLDSLTGVRYLPSHFNSPKLLDRHSRQAVRQCVVGV